MSLTFEPQPVPLTTTPEGVVRVSGTRVPLESAVHAFRQGATPEEIVQDFPSLTLTQVYAVLAYYLGNRAEVDAYMAQQAALSEAAPLAHEESFDPTGIRARLLARRERQESAGRSSWQMRTFEEQSSEGCYGAFQLAISCACPT